MEYSVGSLLIERLCLLVAHDYFVMPNLDIDVKTREKDKKMNIVMKRKKKVKTNLKNWK